MTLKEWHNKWIDAMVNNGISKHDAENAFHALYRNNIFEPTADPTTEAVMLIKQCTSL
jgi:hypothetical protein